jgi:hypothetical protein
MRRRRFQKGSLQLRKHADRRVWVVLYYDERANGGITRLASPQR